MNRKSFLYTMSSHLHLLLVAALVASFAVSLWSVGAGHAATPVAQDGVCPQGSICVNTPLDEKKGNDGLCSLREAIIAANSDKSSGTKPGECANGNGPDTIILPPGTYFLTRTDNGNEDASQTGDLDITDSLNISVDGPGATIDASGITDRILHILSGDVSITGVTFKNGGSNVDDGGGIRNNGALTLTNVTVSGNRASASGGGIYNNGSLTLNNSTIANNTAADGGGIVNNGAGLVQFQNTIIAANGPNDCSGWLSSQGHNLVQNASGCSISGDPTGNIIGQVALLGPLQNNGGKTETHALLWGSPAIDAGNNDTCEATDQRSEIRPLDGDDDRQAVCDIGAFEFRRNNFVLLRAFPTGDGKTKIVGLLDGTPHTTIKNLYFSHTPSCEADPSDFAGPVDVTTDENGYFTAVVEGTVPDPAAPTGFFLTATATDLDGNLLGLSNCVSIGENVVWPLALSLDGKFSSAAVVEQYLDQPGQSRWYKFTVEPDSQVIVTLSNLVTNDDLTIYKDIGAAYAALQAPPDPQDEDLARLGVEFAADSFSADSFSADSFSADSFSADSFSADSFSADSFSADSFSADSFSADSFSADSFSADSFSADSFSADSFSADSFSADSFSADSFSADSFSADSFSSAQTRSLLGVSAFEGTASEGLLVNTWNNTGNFYVRVRGRNGAFSLAQPFHLEVTLLKGSCGQVSSNLPPSSHEAKAGDYKTIILTDPGRMAGTEAEKSDLRAKLAVFASRPEVQGVVVDVDTDARVAAANAQADSHVTCPYAKNLVAQAIKGIVDDYWAQNPALAYVVIVGNDDVIPFFRHPDNALLAPESQYFPPVRDNTASQASLKKDYVLSQDAYGARFDISLNNSTYPVPELAVGRLVETLTDINTVIDAYLSLGNGVVAPGNALVAGYDFLADAATEIAGQLKAGLNNCANCVDDELIYDRDVAPENGWTADQLQAKLLPDSGVGADIVFLAGHFTANKALAADYSTRLSTQDLIASQVDMANSIIFSAGCHAGYNIVDPHDVPYVTIEPDWAQAFASKGATLIAGTGYQYGDTDFLEYSERIYVEFSRQLRRSGPVPIGKALMEAKKVYLSQTPVIRGLHEKALLEATIFGLPMLRVDLAGDYTPLTPPAQTPTLSSFATDPGQSLGLEYGDITITSPSPLNEQFKTLKNVDLESPLTSVTASYLYGNQGIVTSPAEPVLPLEARDVTVDNTVLRGVGFRGGTFEEEDVFPLIGAPTTELRGVHAPFLTDYYYPVQPWRVNYFDALTGGDTLLMVTPAQHKISESPTDPQESTRRQFSDMTFRLYYSNNFQTYTTGTQPSTPALAAGPAIIQVSGVPDPENMIVAFSARVVGNPAAGIQEVWVTYTDEGVSCPCTWQSLNLVQNPLESTLWEGTLPLNGTAPQNIRYIVQAVNGVGVVSRADNMGKFFIPGVDTEPTMATQLKFQSPPTSGAFGTKATFSASLTSGGTGLAGQVVSFRLGPVSRQALTDGDGIATVELSLLAVPGDYQVRALFGGTSEYMASLDTRDFTILKQDTALSLDPPSATMIPGAQDSGIVATLTDATGRALRERSVFFVVTDGSSTYNVHNITDLFGHAPLGPVPLDAGIYDVTAYFGGDGEDETLELLVGAETIILDLGDISYKTSTAMATLKINNPPLAVDDDYSVDEDSVLFEPAPGVLSNDSDTDGQTLTAALVTGPANGELNLNGDGSFSYTPNADYYGPDTFTYMASDGIDDSNVATVTITVNPINDPPVAIDQSVETNEDTPVEITLTASDVEGDSLTYILVSDPSNGTLSGEAPNLTYTPAPDFFGTDSFTFKVNDGFVDSNVATVSIIVNPVNDLPDCSQATPNPEVIWPPDNDFWPVSVLGVTDPDGDPVTITIKSIYQDELVGEGNSFPDGDGINTSIALVRAERDGNGNGRVYHIEFEASDQGGICSSVVLVGIVPHDQGGDLDAIDDGPPWYNSVTGEEIP
jgi:CSLREA domain-containing protein